MGPALVRRDSTPQLCSGELPSNLKYIGTLAQHLVSCGRPTDQKLFTGYIRGVRVTACSSFTSAPPPAIGISTPWEIIVRVFSVSDLPRPWQLLRGLSRLHLLTFSGAFGLLSLGLWIPFWFRSSSLSTLALMFLPFTPHFTTRFA